MTENVIKTYTRYTTNYNSYDNAMNTKLCVAPPSDYASVYKLGPFYPIKYILIRIKFN